MTHPLHTTIVELEERLALAMRNSDATELDTLLANDLVFTSHLGALMSKQDDLAVHASGLLQLESLAFSEQVIRFLGEVAVVAVRVQLTGRYAGEGFGGAFRYTRVWALREGRWQVVVAQASQVAGA